MLCCCGGFAIILQYLYTKSWLPHVSFDAAAELRASVVSGSRWCRLLTLQLLCAIAACMNASLLGTFNTASSYDWLPWHWLR